MAKRNKIETKKEPVELAAATGSDGSVDNNIPVINSTTKNPDKSSGLADDSDQGRHFWYVVYPSEAYIKANYPDCAYDGSSGWGTAPDDWVDQLTQTGLPFCVSPLHDKDVNPDNTPKKPHWHVIVSWGNNTTYRNAKTLCKVLNSPFPQILRGVTGAYRYHTHKDNPEKYQYTENSMTYNGWLPPLDGNEVTRIKREIKEMVLIEDVQEYTELLIICDEMGAEYFDVASSNTFYCEKLCSSYRHNPIRVLKRFFNTLPEGDLKDQIAVRIGRVEHEIKSSCE